MAIRAGFLPGSQAGTVMKLMTSQCHIGSRRLGMVAKAVEDKNTGEKQYILRGEIASKRENI
jgi:hypothetical protein